MIDISERAFHRFVEWTQLATGALALGCFIVGNYYGSTFFIANGTFLLVAFAMGPDE